MTKLTVHYLDQNDKKQVAISTDIEDIKDVLSWWDKAGNGMCLKSGEQEVLFIPFRRVLLLKVEEELEKDALDDDQSGEGNPGAPWIHTFDFPADTHDTE